MRNYPRRIFRFISKGVSKQGSLLVVTLWMLLLLSLLVAAVSFQGGVDAKSANSFQRRFRDKISFRSAVTYGIYLLESDTSPLVDTPVDEWYNPETVAEAAEEFGFAGIRLEIRDEESKLNLNLASEKVLLSFFEQVGKDIPSFSSSPEDLTDDILTYLGKKNTKSRLVGALDFSAKPFRFLEELSLVKSFHAPADNGLFSWLSVFPQTGNDLEVNINTTDEKVLRSVIWSAAADDQAKEQFFQGILNTRGKEDDEGVPFYFDRNDISAYQMLDRLKLTRDVKLVSLGVQVLRNMTVDSHYFSIRAWSDASHRGVEAIVGPQLRAGAGSGSISNYEILSWRELSF